METPSPLPIRLAGQNYSATTQTILSRWHSSGNSLCKRTDNRAIKDFVTVSCPRPYLEAFGELSLCFFEFWSGERQSRVLVLALLFKLRKKMAKSVSVLPLFSASSSKRTDLQLLGVLSSLAIGRLAVGCWGPFVFRSRPATVFSAQLRCVCSGGR